MEPREMIVLSRIIYNENVRNYALQKLHPEHFLSEEAGHIFSAIEKVANNDTFDAALVAKDLERKGYDGVSQINNIINSGYSLPGDSNAIIDELIKESKKSKIRDEMAKHIKDPDPDKLQDLIDRLSRIDAAESEVDIYRQVDGVLREIKQAKERGQLGFPTPFENINNAIRGLQPGHLWVIGGYTSAGKTTMGISLIWNFLKEGAKVAYFSTEIPSNDLIIKCAAHETGIPFLRIKSGELAENEEREVEKSLKLLAAFTPQIIDTCTDFQRIFSKANMIKQGTGLDAVIIDFAQNIRGADDIYTRMSDVAISAQDMARRLKVGVVLFSQLSNDMAKELADLDSGKDPNFVSFKGSGEIGAAADLSILLKKDDKKVRYWVMKNRHGPTVKGEFEFVNHYTRLKETRK